MLAPRAESCDFERRIFWRNHFYIDDREAVHGSDNYPGTFSQLLNAFLLQSSSRC
jgi:hypothetical protein